MDSKRNLASLLKKASDTRYQIAKPFVETATASESNDKRTKTTYIHHKEEQYYRRCNFKITAIAPIAMVQLSCRPSAPEEDFGDDV